MRTKQQPRVLAQGSTGSAGEGQKACPRHRRYHCTTAPGAAACYCPRDGPTTTPCAPGRRIALSGIGRHTGLERPSVAGHPSPGREGLSPGTTRGLRGGLTFPNLHALVAELGTEPAAAMVRARPWKPSWLGGARPDPPPTSRLDASLPDFWPFLHSLPPCQPLCLPLPLSATFRAVWG